MKIVIEFSSKDRFEYLFPQAPPNPFAPSVLYFRVKHEGDGNENKFSLDETITMPDEPHIYHVGKRATVKNQYDKTTEILRYVVQIFQSIQ